MKRGTTRQCAKPALAKAIERRARAVAEAYQPPNATFAEAAQENVRQGCAALTVAGA
jgi:hypothetical protein